ncbi:MAG TPA: UDP-glucose/GDP-mannose dehydrogenase family protein [Burkholderiales bacterium]|nr:UDP-glucose/GDP-mannose dehydrogenase family protein [Burkholderiales bacterium]
MVLLHALIEAGALVRAHDPAAMLNARHALPAAWFDTGRLTLKGQYEAAEGADAVVLVTEWSVYRHPDFERLKRTMRQAVMFDGRNQYDPLALRNEGFEYCGMGRTTPPAVPVAPRLKLAVSHP